MVLSGNNLCKSFQGKEVIKDMDLSLSEGKVHILEGKSGCGKSTLMTLLGLLDSLDKGTIFLDGKQLSGLGSKETEEKRSRNFSFLSQDDNLVEYLSLEDNLFLVTKDRKKIQEGASRLEIFPLLQKPISELSRGEKARGSILRAILEDKPILFLDEPTAHLDTRRSKIVYQWLQELSSTRLLLVISHDIREKCPEYIGSPSFSFLRMKDGVLLEGKDPVSPVLLPQGRRPDRIPFSSALRISSHSLISHALKSSAFFFLSLVLPYFILTFFSFSIFQTTEGANSSLQWICDGRKYWILVTVLLSLLSLGLSLFFFFDDRKEKAKEYTLFSLLGFGSRTSRSLSLFSYLLLIVPAEIISLLFFFLGRNGENQVISGILDAKKSIALISLTPYDALLSILLFVVLPLLLLFFSFLRSPLSLADQMKKDEE